MTRGALGRASPRRAALISSGGAARALVAISLGLACTPRSAPTETALDEAGIATRPAVVDGAMASATGGDAWTDRSNSSALVASDVAALLSGGIGSRVALSGDFLGYRFEGCTFAPPLRTVAVGRSDWVVRLRDSCVVVSGPPPAGLDVLLAEPVENVRFEATVTADGQGLLYLRSSAQ